ncbi:hypothetical protein E8E14_010072 [Neopestalotiopsis sp. 37M]|nr:hypothetical protein E8E14_010072 [Neopestalotiopsis sp. 37M]
MQQRQTVMGKQQRSPAGDAEKKRKQNRIAQQSSRSRQHAYIRNLEALVDAIKVKCDDDDASKYSRLLKAHMQLIEEKRELEDAFLRMRQRLLSIGNMAATAAAAPQEHSPQEHSPQDLAPSYPDTSDGQYDESELISQMVVHHDPSTAAPTCQPSAHTTWLADWGYAALEKGIEPQAGTLAPGPGIMYAQIPRPIFETYVPNTKSISNAAIFAQQVYFAASRVLTGASSNGLVLSTEANQPHLPGYMVNEIASTAVEVIGSLAGLNTYIYGVRFASFMEQVLRWRLTNNAEVRMAIAEPFRPTTLQDKTRTHPIVIDFINWPSIRDQMILLSHKIDLDGMCRDLVLNTVVDIPHRRIAVRVHDILFQHVLPRIQGCGIHGETSMLFNSKWVYLTVHPPNRGTTHGEGTPIEDALAMEIANRIQRRNNGLASMQHASSIFPIPGASGLSTGSVLTTLLPGMLSNFGIDRIETWKVSQDFARKYPYIDCSAVVSAYEMVTCPADLGTCSSADLERWKEISV